MAEKRKRVIVLQNDEDEAKNVADGLKDDFDVVLATDDAEIARSRLESEKPDFLVTELALKKADGIGVMECSRRVSPNTHLVAVSVYGGGDMVRRATVAGAEYYMIKPADYPTLRKRMSALGVSVRAVRAENRALDERISRIFIGMGIPPHIKGYAYLREGIKLAVAEPEIINSVTKRLYPMIGLRFNTSASKVERAVRHAIEVAWSRGKVETFNALFGVSTYGVSEKPTNSEFIALIADRLLLDGLGA